jgi:phenylalanyl-tRNA synthetase beta chain
MKVTYNWLKDFVPIQLKPQQLAGKLTLAGLEVTSLEEKDGDCVLEIEVTANRPDCLCVRGIAREVAAITGKKFARFPEPANRQTGKPANRLTGKPANRLTINIQNKKDCPLYTAKIIRGVKVGPAPEWLRKRLEMVGCRSVNNIVDITNYVLFEFGEPLHAFDYDKLTLQEIRVRRAKNAEKITAIDGAQKELSHDILVIADSERPVAIAGVMGGQDTEVTLATRNILLEAAVFEPVIVRRGRQKLGLQSESSYRFERRVDAGVVEQASWRAAQLITELAGGKIVATKHAGGLKSEKKRIILDCAQVEKFLGVAVSVSRIKSILAALGLAVKPQEKKVLRVLIPSFRPDLTLEVDLIEEIARILGYENIPTTLPAVKPQVHLDDKKGLLSRLKDVLSGLGLNEVITYSLISRELCESCSGGAAGPLQVLNPLSKEQEILRPSIIPGLLKAVADNFHQQEEYVNIFEIAKAFSGASAVPQEELVLGIALSGIRPLLLAQGAVKDEATLLHLKGILEAVFKELGIKEYRFVPASGKIEVFVTQEKIGALFALPGKILDALEIKNKAVFALEVSLDKIFACACLKKEFVPLAKYPSISRDISLALKDSVSAAEVMAAVRQKGAPLLKEAKVIDYYRGKQIPAGCRGLTISCVYRSEEKTLTEEETDSLHARVLEALTQRLGAQIR